MVRNYKAKETVLVITVGCLVLYLVFRGRVFLYCALVIGLAGVFSSWLSAKIDWLWMKLSRLLGVGSNTVLLSLVFFLVVTPVGLIRRWRKKDRLRGSDPGAGATSHFIDRDHRFEGRDLEKTW